MFPNRVWIITAWDLKDTEIDSLYFHSRIPFWVLRLICYFIKIPAPHQTIKGQRVKDITLWSEGFPHSIWIWERK